MRHYLGAAVSGGNALGHNPSGVQHFQGPLTLTASDTTGPGAADYRMELADLAVLTILGAYSLIGVGIIAEKYRYLAQAGADLKARLAGGASAIPQTPALAKAFAEASGEKADPRTIDRELALVSDRATAGMVFLATIGNTAPFVGLFGTVLGIMHAFGKIASTGEAGFETVAGPLSSALIATAAGLGVAIPAVIFYNYFGRRIQSLLVEARYLLERELAERA